MSSREAEKYIAAYRTETSLLTRDMVCGDRLATSPHRTGFVLRCRELFEYLLSHAAGDGSESMGTYKAYSPNSVQLMVAEEDHVDAGLIRAVFKVTTSKMQMPWLPELPSITFRRFPCIPLRNNMATAHLLSPPPVRRTPMTAEGSVTTQRVIRPPSGWIRTA